MCGSADIAKAKIRPVAPAQRGREEGGEGRKGKGGKEEYTDARRDIATALAAPCSLHYRSRSTIWPTTAPRLPT